MFYIIWFILSWTVWLVLADKKLWREILPISLFACAMGATSDLIIGVHYKLWDYDLSGHPILAMTLNDWGLYMVVTYFYIQCLPKQPSILRLIGYCFLVADLSLGIEWVFLVTEHMAHHKFWNLGWSYLFDWTLLTLFYFAHRLFTGKQKDRFTLFK